MIWCSLYSIIILQTHWKRSRNRVVNRGWRKWNSRDQSNLLLPCPADSKRESNARKDTNHWRSFENVDLLLQWERFQLQARFLLRRRRKRRMTKSSLASTMTWRRERKKFIIVTETLWRMGWMTISFFFMSLYLFRIEE